MMFKMLVPVAVLAAGLSMTTVRAVAFPFPDKTELARTAATSMVKERATKVATKSVTKAMTSRSTAASTTTTARSEETGAARTVVKSTARTAQTRTVQTKVAQKKAKVKKVASAKGNRGDVTGSIRKNETCAIKTVELFDRKGNFAKSERMRVCQ